MAMVDIQKYLVFGRTNSLRFNALSLAGRRHLTLSNLPSALPNSVEFFNHVATSFLLW